MEHSNIVSTAMKRAVEHGHENYDLPPWALAVVVLTAAVFFPVVLFTSYTLNSIYPTLAIVEDANPPTYEPVALSEDAEVAAAPPQEPKAISSSLRAINRLLFSVGGWRASFRGLWCAFSMAVSVAFVGGIFNAIPFIPAFLGTLLASLALVQLETAWVHIVISNPSSLPFWKRLPPFRKTFEATCIPVFVNWLAASLMGVVPLLLAAAMNLPVWAPKEGGKIPKYDSSLGWKGTIIGLVGLAMMLLLVIPAQVVLVRVQASLLPEGEDPIIPFDRSFDGTVEPAIVGGKGYVSWKNALKTFPRASWIRLYVLYGKVFLVTMASYALLMAVVIPEVILLSRKSEGVN